MGELQRVELVEQIFHEALERDDARRAGFLAEACAGNVALLAEVASLLASYGQHQDFLKSPAFNLSASDLAGSVLDDEGKRVLEAPRINGFQLLREVGHGGMGAVYEAFTFSPNGDVEERVAVKLIKRGMDSEFILHRFERERRILGALDHPYVARLLDGGATDDGMPFFVMEYVEGLPIDQYTQAATLSTAERLGLFLKVCEAVSYAHRHRVIHRDLKPSNILVTEDGVPKLLDFGVAKLLDLDSAGGTGEATATVNHVMTPEYASPAQLRGLPPKETDDVYSLGVLLHILLTGRHPYRFRSRAPEEILRCILEQRVQRPSELQRDLKGNLDRVVLKALRKESERRYASVEEMAQDIRRHLAGQRVSARRDLLTYHAAHFAATHRAYMLTAIGVALLCVLVGILTLMSPDVKPTRSLAVMPFSDMGQGTYSEQLANSITEGLTEHLSQLPQLSIRSRNSVSSYKRRQYSPQTIGRSLDVERLLIGDVVLDDARLKIRVELLDVGSGKSLWTNTYDAQSSEVLTVQRRLTADVMRKLGVAVIAEEMTHSRDHHPENEEAYSDYMMGRYFFNKRRKDDLHKGIEYFRQAIAKDPSYAPAYAGLADCYGLLGAYMVMEPHEAFTSAREAANKALELDEGLAEAHTSLALVRWLYDWDWAAADLEFRTAIKLNPSYALAHHWRGLFLGEMGRFSEAEAELQIALEYDPLSAPVYADYGRVLYWARRYDESLEKYRMASDLNPDFGSMRIEREMVYDAMGRVDDWAASIDQSGNFDAETRKAFRAHGPKGYWTVWYRRELSLRELGRGDYNPELFARMGDKDRALEDLVAAMKMRDHRVTQIRVDPVLDPLRSDPRFAELLRQMNLKP